MVRATSSGGSVGGSNGRPPAAVCEHHRGDAAKVVDVGGRPILEPGVRGRGPAQREVGSQAFGTCGDRESGRRPRGSRREPGHCAWMRPPSSTPSSRPNVPPASPPVDRIEGAGAAPPRRGRRRGRCRNSDAQPEAVEQLRPQLPFLRVHRADEHELAAMSVRHALTLDDVHPDTATSSRVSTRWSASRFTSST